MRILFSANEAPRTDTTLPRSQKILTLTTDIGLLAYWALSALLALGLLRAPEWLLFADYHEPIMTAWNWSFLPLDVLLSVLGIAAVSADARGCAEGAALSQISLSLTFCAGFMALSFWAIRCEFDPIWWGVNLFLAVWPVPFLARGVFRTAAS
jgi:hypothetical protein